MPWLHCKRGDGRRHLRIAQDNQALQTAVKFTYFETIRTLKNIRPEQKVLSIEFLSGRLVSTPQSVAY